MALGTPGQVLNKPLEQPKPLTTTKGVPLVIPILVGYFSLQKKKSLDYVGGRIEKKNSSFLPIISGENQMPNEILLKRELTIGSLRCFVYEFFSPL